MDLIKGCGKGVGWGRITWLVNRIQVRLIWGDEREAPFL